MRWLRHWLREFWQHAPVLFIAMCAGIALSLFGLVATLLERVRR
jgi:hypothetical protein